MIFTHVYTNNYCELHCRMHFFFFFTTIFTYIMNTWSYSMHSALASQTYVYGIYWTSSSTVKSKCTSTIRLVTTDFNQNKWSEQQMKWRKKKEKKVKRTAGNFCRSMSRMSTRQLHWCWLSFIQAISQTNVRFILLCTILCGCEAVKIRMQENKFA